MYRFRLHTILRVLLIAVTLAAAMYLYLDTPRDTLAIALGILAGIQVIYLIRYVEATNREVSRFLRSIRYGDFSQNFSSNRGRSFEELSDALSEVMEEFRSARLEKARQARYLRTIVNHVGVGLLCFDDEGSVNLINRSAKRLLDVPRLREIGELEEISPELHETLRKLPSGEKILMSFSREGEDRQLSIYSTVFRLRGSNFKLVSLQDIQSELETRELEAWQKLTRVLTHEMMNSITPIASMADTIGTMLGDVDHRSDTPMDGETLGDIQEAASTIGRRSEHLLNFVQQYRQLTRVPDPDRAIIDIKDLFDSVIQLARAEDSAARVAFKCKIRPESLQVSADQELFEQVLINLIHNSIQALKSVENPCIRLTAGIDRRGRSVIRVIDNGPGIAPEAREKIFLPFFTTKKEGSGIGLALSKQILRKHGGTIHLASDTGDTHTEFVLRF